MQVSLNNIVTTLIIEGFTDLEIEIALKIIKNGKAAEADGVLPEFLKFLGLKSKN